MIRLSKDRVLEDFFIDDNGVITNKEGEIQKFSYYGERPYFKSTAVHKIQMWTKYGWRDTKIWTIHHIDEDKSNNAISNLVFMPKSEHASHHFIDNRYSNGRFISEETKSKISKTMKEKCKDGFGAPWKGKNLPDYYRKKLSEAHKGQKWFNDGVKEYMMFPEDVPPHYQKGRLKCKK